eukprot:6189866-Pleurochrysis_carterae.AAC.2
MPALYAYGSGFSYCNCPICVSSSRADEMHCIKAILHSHLPHLNYQIPKSCLVGAHHTVPTKQ